jgi:hypothetical protein
MHKLTDEDREYYQFWLLQFKGIEELLTRTADEGMDTEVHNEIWKTIGVIEKKLNINQNSDYFKGV